ncbi:MAG: hypothetical protein HP498_03305 [Nitrospira sp.]|nr:hypothetical protein [Nitrospira sp.]
MLTAIVRRAVAWSAVIACLVGSEAPCAAADPETGARRFQIEFETGAIWQSRNEIHIPDSAAGTRFSLADIQDGTQRRVEATWHPGHRHALRFVYQPLGFSGAGSFATPVLFAGGTFAPGTPVESDYKFDSYRVTYRYLFYESSTWGVSAGATAFIRDAKVELRQAGSTATDSNVGFVPLLSLNAEYRFAPRWMAVVDVDGLVAPQGRAFDAAAKIRHDLTDHWSVSAGYRTFEGGVDNGERFAFGWFHFAVVSIGYRY